jgi:hypothetical protein
MNIIQTIGIGVLSMSMTVSSWFGVTPQNIQNPLGSTFQTGEVRGLFVTTLASRITSTDTSMTLTSATDKDGNTLASSTYGFIIDEGTSIEEFVLADCTGTACTNMTRGVSVSTGTSTVSTLRFAHSRGAEVKITDAPALIFATNVFKGKQNIENKLRYDSAQTFNDSNDIISRSYADSLSFGSVPAASETASGFVELATQTEAASSTSANGATRLVLGSNLATSTFISSTTSNLRVVMTGNTGKIDNNFLSGVALTASTNTWTSVNTFSTTTATSTMIGSMPAYWIGKNSAVITTLGTSTFSVPSGINKVHVRVQGAGGSGGGPTCNGTNNLCGSGGAGAGGYAEGFVDVTGTSTIQVFVGTGGAQPNWGGAGVNGTWSTFGTNGYYMYANGGSGGSNSTGSGGASGGTASGGSLINITGGTGGPGTPTQTSVWTLSGYGGSSLLGSGGSPCMNQCTGSAATGYGSGGAGGGGSQGGGAGRGGAGANGIVIIDW